MNDMGNARYRARRTENQAIYSKVFRLILVWDKGDACSSRMNKNGDLRRKADFRARGHNGQAKDLHTHGEAVATTETGLALASSL